MPHSTTHCQSLSPYNEVELSRKFLPVVLDDLSKRLLVYFGRQVRLIVHGGAVMVLHPWLACRESTRDVDYNHRSFESEWRQLGVHDAGARLKKCIAQTARAFNLGADWMNACADVALPMARDTYGNVYDPIFADATSAHNVRTNTIFVAPGLMLIGVSWSWAVALKLVRYQKHDPHDIAHILRLGHRMRGVQWTRSVLEGWLLSMCATMGYAAYPPQQMEATRDKMRHAIRLAQAYG
ncbi:hypothetical protein A0H81_06743 [Grifola frondosa]|uniref:Uncharacterized protein n=1 Tax=Grifola frondosa TaxID=5627 RepID=A0A1C7MDP1_GRIFR|nr:hypothetical protein A0H81_06743 [Grifola frondosa]